MTPRDLLRIGVTVLNNGAWNCHQVIPSDWLKSSFNPAVSMPDGRHYGYHWYLGAMPMDDGTGSVRWEKTVSAMGNGGQSLFLLPRLEMAVAVTAGNYDAPGHWRAPIAVLRDVLLPAMRAEQ
jgi:CubicO group peptidase (beta-lactamase class C family)